MSNVAIRAENLGKCYPLKRGRHESARERITAMWQRGISGCSTPETECNEGYFWALKGASFELHRGEIVSLSGHNGAGKTTLLRILSRVTDPTEGRVEIYGRTSSLLDVGAGFHSQLTGRENVYVYGAVLGMMKYEIRREFDAIVSFADLDKFIDTPIKRWSRGMCVRLAFSVAAHLQSDILLIDDLLDAADADFRNRCIGKIFGSAIAGRLVIFVSHDSAYTRTRELCFERGRIISDDRCQQTAPAEPLGHLASL